MHATINSDRRASYTIQHESAKCMHANVSFSKKQKKKYCIHNVNCNRTTVYEVDPITSCLSGGQNSFCACKTFLTFLSVSIGIINDKDDNNDFHFF